MTHTQTYTRLIARSLGVAAVAIGAQTALAQDAPADCAVRIGSGPKGGVYEILARDIQAACGHVVSTCSVRSQGGLQNLMKLSASEVDVGFAQVDMLQTLAKDGDENVSDLQAVMPLHSNLLHILALRKGYTESGVLSTFKEPKIIRKFSDLKGLKVAAVGSSQLLGPAINSRYGYGMEFVMIDTDDEAVESLRKNKVAAIFTNGGWPMPNISRFDSTSGLTLVGFDEAIKAPYTTSRRSYQELGALNINFLAAPNLLITRPFKPGGDMGKKVTALQNCLIAKLDTLQEGRFHSAWKEIKQPTNTMGIPRFNGEVGKAVAAKP